MRRFLLCVVAVVGFVFVPMSASAQTAVFSDLIGVRGGCAATCDAEKSTATLCGCYASDGERLRDAVSACGEAASEWVVHEPTRCDADLFEKVTISFLGGGGGDPQPIMPPWLIGILGAGIGLLGGRLMKPGSTPRG